MQILDRFLPQSVLRQPRERRRGRLIVGTCFTVSTVLIVLVTVRWLIRPLMPAQLALTLLSVFLLAAIPWCLRYFASLALAGWLTTCVFMVLIGAQTMWAGGVQAPVAVLIPIIPLLATHLVGPSEARRTMVGVTFLVVMLGFFLPSWIELPALQLSRDEEQAARGAMILAALVLVEVLSLSYENQRKALEQQLRQSDALYRRIFDQSKDMVALATPKGKLVDVNQAGVELFGFNTKNELMQADTRSFYLEPAERQELLRRLEADGFVRGYESRQLTRQGQIKTVQGTTTAIRNAKGKVSMFLTILRDVTAERQATVERERMVQQLKHKNEELRGFAYAVSHDLKSPLITLRSFLGFLVEDARTGDLTRLQEDLEPIVRTADRMQVMVDDLLEFATLGVDARSRHPVDLGEVVREVQEMSAGRLLQGGVEMRVDPDLPTLVVDRSLLRALFLNLVDNAAKFLVGRPSPTLEVFMRPGTEPPVLCVQDNGPGIPEHAQEAIFGLFSKLDSSQAGTGVGLAICKKVVDLHGGEIWVESQVGQGAAFCFTLPG